LALLVPENHGAAGDCRFCAAGGWSHLIGDTDVTAAPYKRGLAMVVQNYALFRI
jgi:2-aminoethylphosphonate transport system ATP-binding protein